MRNLLLGLISSIILLGATLTLIPMEEAESLLAIPPTRAFSTFLSDAFGVNISAALSTDSATFSGGDLTFFPSNNTIDFGANATALFEQLNATLFSLNGTIPVLIAGDQIDLNTIGNLTEISLEDCIQDEFLLYDSGVWTCVDVGTLNGTGGGTSTPHIEELDDVYFNAEEASIDDMTGTNCVNDVSFGFFDNTLENQYTRQVVEFCGNADEDDNITWLYTVPQQYNSSDATDFEYDLFWTDDSGGGGTFIQRISVTEDDAEQENDGTMSLSSSDLELYFQDGDEEVGMRFTGVTIPNGATITNAEIQFHADEVGDNSALTVFFTGEDVDDCSTYTSTDFDITNRVNTTAQVSWAIPAWTAIHDEGAAQLTPDLSSIIQEIIDRPGWTSSNDLCIMISVPTTPIGIGERTAEAFDGEPESAPEISITFTTGANTDVCWTFSLIALSNSEIMDGNFTSFQTVCTSRSGVDQLTITTFDVNSTSHNFMMKDLVFFKIHRPDDFIVDDFEGDAFVFGSELNWLN